MSGYIKLFLMLTMMVFGFWFTYMFVWNAMGFELTKWSVPGLFILALVSEYAYFLWVRI